MPIDRTGPVATGTIENLRVGLRAKPMPLEATLAAFEQAVGFTERLVESYERKIAPGEVGEGGSRRASDAPILAGSPPTTLMYGRIQSGKTAAMVLTSALCLDNGFRIVVVLTADNVALVRQTANRFKALDGPRVFSSEKDDTYEWTGQEDELREDVPVDGLVLVCAKDAFHLPRIIQFLQQIEASAYPTLVLDDEADAATPDTTLAARTSGRHNAPEYPSTIHRRVIENAMPGQEGESIAEILPHSILVQVTATPFILLLLRRGMQVRPSDVLLLEPGEGYCGGEEFFGAFDPDLDDTPPAPLVLVPPGEAAAMGRRAIPTGLRASIDYFLLAAAAKRVVDDRWPVEGYKHLSHTSHRISQHAVVANHIERYIRQLRRLLRGPDGEAQEAFSTADRELRRTIPDLPEWATLKPHIIDAIRQADCIRVNSETQSPQYGPRVTFLVGGNILGRGLTIDDLLVTYYIREARVSQMDTVWQHARMYGYRKPSMPYTRVYLPRPVANRFRFIHETEEALRQLVRDGNTDQFPIVVAPGTRPTRPNATERDSLRIYRRGFGQVAPLQPTDDPTGALSLRDSLLGVGVPLEEPDRDRRPTRVPAAVFFELVESVSVSEQHAGRWDAEALIAILETFRDALNEEAIVYVRELGQGADRDRQRGRLSGPEIEIIRAAAGGAVPALALLYVGTAEAPRGWYPTLVFPPDTPSYVFSPLD